jgi:hypothetical protein
MADLGEPTIREAYEALILETAALRANQAALNRQMGQVVTALMGRNRARTFTPDQWEKAAGRTIRLTPQPDGSLQLTVEVPDAS